MLFVLALLGYGGLPSNNPAGSLAVAANAAAWSDGATDQRYLAPTQVKEYRTRLATAVKAFEGHGDMPFLPASVPERPHGYIVSAIMSSGEVRSNGSEAVGLFDSRAPPVTPRS